MTGVQFPVGAIKGFFSSPPCPDWLWGPSSPLSKGMEGGALSPEVKRSGRESDHSPPSSAEVKNAWSYTSTPQYAFMAYYLVKNRDNLT
jgi:hypothetical protein